MLLALLRQPASILTDPTRHANLQDLNYRISLTSPERLDRDKLVHDLSELAAASRNGDAAVVPAKLLAQDQLRQEQARNKALHHLREGEITFPPTYKYKPGSRDELSSKRVPGWCDRVLYASAAATAAAAAAPGGEVKVLSYRSVMEFTRSDHKPVSPGAFLLLTTPRVECQVELRLTGVPAKS